jgi:LPXTG-motif cell wall-anchored protein
MLSLSCSSALADTHAEGVTKDSPGVLSGNVVQVPVEAPVNVCGNTVNGIAVFNGAFGNSCANTPGETDDYGDSGYGTEDETPASPGGSPTPSPSDDCETPAPTPPPTQVVETPPSTPPTRTSQTPPPAGHEPHGEPPQLAETGSKTMLAASAASAALITGGVLMYRRGRAAFQR